jgi:hypothetical protein
MIFMPCLFLNCAEIYVIEPENTCSESPYCRSTDVLIDDDIANSSIEARNISQCVVLRLENESLDNTELQTASLVDDNY